MSKYRIVRADNTVIETEYTGVGSPEAGKPITLTYTVKEVRPDGTVVVTPLAGSLGSPPPGSKGSVG